MTTFLDALRGNTHQNTYTENGALTNKSTGDPVVDFFSRAGAMRGNVAGAVDLFDKALTADPLTAVRTLFYLRDVRGGQGERDVFRAGLAHLRNNWGTSYGKLIEHVPFYGRWDDVLHDGIALDPITLQLIAAQLKADSAAMQKGEPVSLMAKWLPSENASSPRTKLIAKKLAAALGFTPRQYRKALSALRGHISLLEQDMSRNNWDGIDYGKLPSQAHRKHVKAFYRHSEERYTNYLASVEKGEAKINTATLYPYELFELLKDPGQHSYMNTAWANLPDFTQGKDALVMADVSGSMVRPYQSANPIAVSVSLALYFAERNQGAFQDYFMTFSGEPELVHVNPNLSLSQKFALISQAKWAMNTNLSEAFRTILIAAVNSGEAPPAVLYIISDMEFDQASRENKTTVFQQAKAEFASHGLQLPHVVFWNVAARTAQSPAVSADGNVTLVSGCSPSVFSMAVEGKSPLELVHSVVHGERYQRITL